MAGGVKKYPLFFTIFVPEQHSQTMKVPKVFLKKLNEDLSSNAVLSSSSSGDKWQVSVLKKGNEVYMQNGWPKFVTDSSIVLHDVLLFTYHGENCFHVQIFDKNGVERLCLKETTQEKKDMPCRNKGFIFTGSETMKTGQKQTATPSLARTKKKKERHFSPG
ncbi:B3 domain-containing protein REM20-like, partial [Vigna umbellata]|uniref:B3 domain-containing protein REM20-like n=1 Tax=Vigna umbellata TaxID=87088 RepID=UPI001F5F6E88